MIVTKECTLSNAYGYRFTTKWVRKQKFSNFELTQNMVTTLFKDLKELNTQFHNNNLHTITHFFNEFDASFDKVAQFLDQITDKFIWTWIFTVLIAFLSIIILTWRNMHNRQIVIVIIIIFFVIFNIWAYLAVFKPYINHLESQIFDSKVKHINHLSTGVLRD